MLIEIPHPCGSADGGGPPSRLVVSDHSPARKTRFLMLTREDDVDIHALHRQGWTVSAIARHTGRDRKTVRAYLTGARLPGVRARTDDPFAMLLDYVRARLVEDPHLWALTL